MNKGNNIFLLNKNVLNNVIYRKDGTLDVNKTIYLNQQNKLTKLRVEKGFTNEYNTCTYT